MNIDRHVILGKDKNMTIAFDPMGYLARPITYNSLNLE